MSRAKLIAIALLFTSGLGTGWMVRGWYEGYVDKSALESLAKKTADDQQQSELEAQRINKAAGAKRRNIENEYAEIENEIRAAGDLGCMSDDVARLHHRIVEAVSGRHYARVRCDKP